MATTPSKQALRQYRREHQLCIQCGHPAIPSQRRCESCVAKDKERRKRYVTRDANLGICCSIGCSNKPKPGRKYCDTCSQKSADRTAARRHARLVAGLCSRCGAQPRWAGAILCEACRALQLAASDRRKQQRAAAGQCYRCGELQRAPRKRATSTSMSQYRQQRSDAGQCTKCRAGGDAGPAPGYKLCQCCIDKGRERHAANKLAVLAAYGGAVCQGCGETEVAVLQIDHIYGGGHRHALQIGNGHVSNGRSKMYKWLRDNGYPPGFRVLCANCNLRAARGIPFPNVT